MSTAHFLSLRLPHKPTTISCSVAALSSCNDANLALEVPFAFTNARGLSAAFSYHECCGVDKARLGVAGDIAPSRASGRFRSPATAPSLCLLNRAAEPQTLARHQSMQAQAATNVHHSILLFKPQSWITTNQKTESFQVQGGH